jgi:hypothetical protein
LHFWACPRVAIIALVLRIDEQRLEATMRILRIFVGVTLLMATAACAYYGPGYRHPYYYGPPQYYRY